MIGMVAELFRDWIVFSCGMFRGLGWNANKLFRVDIFSKRRSNIRDD
jgi:hypothetical protein